MLAITPNASNFIILFLASVLKDSSWIKFFPLSAKYSIAHTHLSISALASLMALPISFVAVLERFSFLFLAQHDRENQYVSPSLSSILCTHLGLSLQRHLHFLLSL